MTIIYVYWNRADWALPVFRCSQRISKAKVIVVSEFKNTIPDIQWLDINSFERAKIIRSKLRENGVSDFEACSFARWFVIQEVAQKFPDIFPLFCADWDEFILFPEIPQAEFDYGTTFDEGLPRAPLLLAHAAPLNAFCDHVESAVNNCAPSLETGNDMCSWKRSSDLCAWKTTDLAVPVNWAVYDHSLGAGKGTFQHENGGKKIVWRNKTPYFVTHGGAEVLARSIQCWGEFKKYITTIEENL